MFWLCKLQIFNLLRKSTDKVLSLYSIHSPIPIISSPDAINMVYFNIYITLLKKYYWFFFNVRKWNPYDCYKWIYGIYKIYKFMEIALFTEH